MNRPAMNIAYTFDDGYTDLSLVSMRSLLDNNKSEALDMYVVDCGISEKNKGRIAALCREYGRQVEFRPAIDLEQRISVHLETLSWTSVCFVRLFFPEIFLDLDRVIHIDGDTIVRGSLAQVYYSDMDGKSIGACFDCVPSPKVSGGFPIDTEYVNNGFLIFNLTEMRKKGIQQKFTDYIVEKKGCLAHLDQDVVNGVLQGEIKILPAACNYMVNLALFEERCAELFREGEPYYSREELKKAAENPLVIHFVGNKYVSRPWERPCYHPYRKEWNAYAQPEIRSNPKLRRWKKKKHGLLREAFCLGWNLAYQIPFCRNLQFAGLKKRMHRKCGSSAE